VRADRVIRVVASALLALCGGCESGSTTGGSAAAPTPVRRAHGQHLRTAMISDPKTFNPIIVTDTASGTATDDVFDPLIRLDPVTLDVEPVLAERWERNADGTEWTFALRRGVRWHDGTPFTAADVTFTFDAIFDNRVPNSSKHVLTIRGQRIAVEALDAHTVRFRLPEPFAPFLNSIAGTEMLPAHVLRETLAAGTFAQQWGINTPPERIVGTGPYRMVKYVPAQYLRYRRNPDYWRRDDADRALPYLEEQTILVVPSQDTAYLKFRAGETDIHAPRPEEVSELREQATALDITVREIGLDTGTTFVVFNRNPRHYEQGGKRDPRLTWFTDLAFLRAIAHSIDKEAMIRNCLNGFGQPAIGEISPENRRFHHPDLADYPYDLDKAKSLLEEAGYRDHNNDGLREDRDGHPLEFTLHNNAGNQIREKMCSILQEDWKKLGIKVNYRPLDFTLLVEKLDTTFDWDAILIGFTASVEPHNGANLLRSSANLHMWHPNQAEPATAWEAEIDQLLDRGARELDEAKRQQIYRRIQEILHRELPMIQTVRPMEFSAYADALQNYRPTVWGVYRPELLRFAD
jgi:peptide/nickel transport system substrate-binding protein